MGWPGLRPLAEPEERLARLARLVSGELRGDATVRGVSVDSRRVAVGDLFCAIRGARVNGHDFAPAAVRAGAAALMVERWLPLEVPQLRVTWTRLAVGPVAAAVYGNPADRLDAVGVTGTNGKTTVTHLLRAGLLAAGRQTGLIGTVANCFDGWREETVQTTPDAPALHRTLARMVLDGADSVVMEVSSQGLDQHRVDGMRFQLAVFLNLGQDHLDYHGTVEQYYAAKASLFEPRLSTAGLVCVNDPWGRRLAAQARIPVLTVGRDPRADVQVQVVASGVSGTEVLLTGVGRALRRLRDVLDTIGVDAGDDEPVHVRAPVVGDVNADNIAAAYVGARALGASSSAAVTGLADCASVPGRFERVDCGQPFLVIVDYAHTPDAYASLIRTARTLTGPGGRVHLVVGARGDKDRFKRPATGRVAAQADHPILTTDSPGSEDPARILAEVMVGLLDVPHDHVEVEPDRAAAIRLAVRSACPGDVVLIVGRGHERTRRLGDRVERFDDRQVAAAALADRGFFAMPGPVGTRDGTSWPMPGASTCATLRRSR